MKAVKLKFRTPIRIGELGIGLESTSEILHSDTLFNAIANALVNINGDLEEFVERIRSGELKISSAFPFRGDTYYLPLPILPYDKKIKAKFVSKDDFEMLIAGEMIDAKPEDMPYKVYDLPKVLIDRATANTSIYYVSLVRFERNCGLYFIVDGNGKKLIEPALKYLEDEGIGGKRTWGLGRFEHEWDDDFNIITPSESNAFVTLSLVFPNDLNFIQYWKPIIRSGWTLKGKQVRKPRIIMASEGSIFSSRDEGILLDLDDVVERFSEKAGHKVFVNGKSFLIPTVVNYGD
jgi:CRISPR-associated protein Csm4